MEHSRRHIECFHERSERAGGFVVVEQRAHLIHQRDKREEERRGWGAGRIE